jgi:hypothetical protein
MKLLLVLVPIVLTLAACGDGSKIKEAVRQSLKDSGSAKFGDTIISSDAKRACILWNAKNSFGGYSDWSFAELKNIESKWKIIKMEGSQLNCSETAFKAIDAGEEVTYGARRYAISLLEKARNISHDEASTIGIKGECKELVSSYIYHSKNVAENKVRYAEYKAQIYASDLKFHENELEKNRYKLESGNCEYSIWRR